MSKGRHRKPRWWWNWESYAIEICFWALVVLCGYFIYLFFTVGRYML